MRQAGCPTHTPARPSSGALTGTRRMWYPGSVPLGLPDSRIRVSALQPCWEVGLEPAYLPRLWLRQYQGRIEEDGKIEPSLGKSEIMTRHRIFQFLLLKSLLITSMYLLIICDLL